MTAQIPLFDVHGTPYTPEVAMPELCDHRRLDRGDGAQRLLRMLVRRGLAGEHLPAAAALCLA